MAATLDWTQRCQHCGKKHATTKRREVYLKNFVGPCRDSFCYASCDSSACRPVTAALCEPCTEIVSLKRKRP